MRLKVNVLPTDIRKGWRDNCLKCPVARAAIRAFAPLMKGISGFGVLVYHRDIWVVDDPLNSRASYRLDTPKKVRKFIINFDTSKGPKEPFSFTLPVNLTALRAAFKHVQDK